MHYFEQAGDDPSSTNALGVIYQSAPDVFEKDPVRLSGYGKIRKDTKKARTYFDNAS